MVEINNRTDYDLDLKNLKSLAERAATEKAKLSVAFLEAPEIKKLNERYRDSKGPTDVLSFEGEDDFLGEVLISPEVVEKQADKHGLSFKKEIERVLVHGILHLIGYEHKTEDGKKAMKKKEKELLSG